MTIKGEVEEIVFRNSDNGYTVLDLAMGDELVTCVGSFPIINVGEVVTFEGEFKLNNKYGKQFAVSSSSIAKPSGVEGIKKYIGSGLIPGIGPVTAEAIVSHFGADTLHIIEFAPRKLAEVRGVSAKKAESIGQAYGEIKKMQNTILFLQKFDMTVNMAMRVFEVYGEKSESVIRKNPYKLVEDVEGIGFLTADKLAAKMGIEPTSAFRLRAGVLYCLKDAAEKGGNTYLPRFMLDEALYKLLNTDFADSIKSVLDELAIEKIIVILFHDDFGQIIALSRFYNSEKAIAEKICMFNFTDRKVKLNIKNEISHFEKKQKIEFHETQKSAIEMAINSGVSIITGGPGTGKTTIVKCVLTLLNAMHERVLMLAPTGRAAKRLSESTDFEAKTIHRGLDYEPHNKAFGFKFNEHNKLPFDVVIVDEVSMVDTLLFLSLLKAMPQHARLILVGDKDQLASVGAGNVLADLLTSGVVAVTNLTQIYRQSEDSYIIVNAHAINRGEMPNLDNASKDFFFEKKDEPSAIADCVINLVTTRLPQFFKKDGQVIKNLQVLAPMKIGVCGIDALNARLQEKLNPPRFNKAEIRFPTVIFREGDRVMQTQNNYEQEWIRRDNFTEENGSGVFNGDIGIMKHIDPRTGEAVIFFEDGREAVYTRDTLSQITLSYAITVHKSQGCEFDVVVLPVLSGAHIILTRNLLYTAVTRAKKMVVLVGSKTNLGRMVRNNYTARRFSSLKNLLIEKQEELKNLYE